MDMLIWRVLLVTGWFFALLFFWGILVLLRRLREEREVKKHWRRLALLLSGLKNVDRSNVHENGGGLGGGE